jgi:Mrp family chromosome partitioning ATPase
MDARDREDWAFRTWTLLKGKLTTTDNRGIVCGVVSCLHGEGRSTWINLLAKAAGDRGCRILAISTSPSAPSSGRESPPNAPGDAPDESAGLEKNVLAFPAQVTEKLLDQNAGRAICIPLPEWVWNLDRRRQWRSALESWSSVEDLVMLIELPPASMPESVLLAENLPQLIWLTGSGMARTAETQLHLETLRHAGCNLVGAVLNREPSHA